MKRACEEHERKIPTPQTLSSENKDFKKNNNTEKIPILSTSKRKGTPIKAPKFEDEEFLFVIGQTPSIYKGSLEKQKQKFQEEKMKQDGFFSILHKELDIDLFKTEQERIKIKKKISLKRKQKPSLKKTETKRRYRTKNFLIENSEEIKIIGKDGKLRMFEFDWLKILAKKRREGKQGLPMDISQDIGAEELDTEEYEFCTVLRLTPKVYKDSCKILLENSKIKFYNKSYAQKLLSIDVNKTGRIYDFLVYRKKMFSFLKPQ